MSALRLTRALLLLATCAGALLLTALDAAPLAPATSPDLVRVEVVALRSPEEARALVLAAGGRIEVESHGRIQALVPHSGEAMLLQAREVVEVAPPAHAIPLQVVAAEELIGVTRWQAAGFTGHGVRVAVLDSGFQGMQAALGSTLPATVVSRSFRSDGNLNGGTEHGRRAAEIIHRLAPGASLTLVNFSTVTELSAAVDFLIEQRVDVISFSLGYVHNGPGDGSGAVNAIVSRATGAGIAWAVASGNWAQQHYAGTFRDTDRDGLHEFASGVETNQHAFNAGDLITVSLRWEDTWGAACSDYDLELFGPDGGLVRAARGIQNCSGDPVESLQVLATRSGAYSVRVVEARSDVPKAFDLMVVGAPDRGGALEFNVAAGSLSQPADHPDVVTVGALTVAATREEAAYSSRGPTTDGRPKPEILAPTGVTSTSTTFAGTSAAAPHVAAVMAMLKEAFPSADRARLTALIQTRAVAVPSTGDASGARRVDLGTLVGLGPLLPEGASEASVAGDLPTGPGLALVIYRGPDAYPAKFLHLQVDGRRLSGIYRVRVPSGFDAFIPGAPAWVQRFTALNNGQLLVLRFAE